MEINYAITSFLLQVIVFYTMNSKPQLGISQCLVLV